MSELNLLNRYNTELLLPLWLRNNRAGVIVISETCSVLLLCRFHWILFLGFCLYFQFRELCIYIANNFLMIILKFVKRCILNNTNSIIILAGFMGSVPATPPFLKMYGSGPAAPFAQQDFKMCFSITGSVCKNQINFSL